MSNVTITKGKKKIPSADNLLTALQALQCTAITATEMDKETVTAQFTDGPETVTETALRLQLDSGAKTNWWGIKLT